LLEDLLLELNLRDNMILRRSYLRYRDREREHEGEEAVPE